LRNLIERSLLRLSPTEHWLPLDLTWLQSATPMGHVSSPASFVPVAVNPLVDIGNAKPVFPGGGGVVPAGLTPIEEQEYQLIARALEDSDGSIRKAASKVGLSHQTLLRRLQRWPELRRTLETPQAA
jgi:DNA-binding NtrC family response regulator